MAKLEIEILKGETCKLVSTKPNYNMFYGFPYGGAMDLPTAQCAHGILKQNKTLSIIEVSLKAPTMKFNADVEIVVTGADMKWSLDGELIAHDKMIAVKKAQILSGKFIQKGFRSYIAVDRKIINLKDGVIKLGRKNKKIIDESLIRSFKVPSQSIAVHRGPEWNLLGQEGKETMFNYSGKLGQDVNRMGAYLIGPKVDLEEVFPKKSVCTFPGVIQLLPNGQLIVLLQDAQTTGGYPRIAYLDKEALYQFNQLTPGQKIEWRMIL